MNKKEPATIKVKAIRHFLHEGEGVAPKTELELDYRTGMMLIHTGKAEAVEPKKKAE